MMPLGDDDSGRRSTPVVTYALIALNVLVFLLETSAGNAFIEQWAFVPARFLANPAAEFVTIFSSMFMHAGTVHLGGNMLYLWIFGDNVEDNFGAVKYLIFYLLAGIGAIAGVLGAYLVMFPRGQIRVLVGRVLTTSNALIVIGFWFVLQLFSGVGSIGAADTGGVAYMAHVGGFVAGLLFSFVFRDTSRLTPRM